MRHRVMFDSLLELNSDTYEGFKVIMKKVSQRHAMGCVGVILAGVVLTGVSPAMAADSDEPSPALTAFEEQAPVEISDSVESTSTVSRSDNASATVDETTAYVHTPAGTIALEAAPNTESVTSEPILMKDGSALIAIVIDEPTIETSYRMDMALPAAASATIEEDGSVLIQSSDGEFVGGIATPWARDANGGEVPTSFEIDGGTLVQHVDLDAVSADAYPVVADPWAGHDLVASAWVTSQGGSAYNVNAVPTSWGEFYRGISTLESHLADLRADLGTNKSKVTSTIINQFYCHVAYGWLGGGATYNMESTRPDILWSIQGNPVTKCNP